MASRTYQELLSQAKVNFEFFREDIQNRGTVPMTMTVSGIPSFKRVGKTIGLASNADADNVVSNGVAAVLDVTGTVTCEAVFCVPLAGRTTADLSYLLWQTNLGGFTFFTYSSSGTCDVRLYFIDSAGVTARRIISPTNVYSPGTTWRHAVITSIAGGTSGLIWINGIPQTPSYVGAGTAANCGTAMLYTAYCPTYARSVTERIRAWQGSVDQNEVTTLYQNYLQFTRPSKC